ncbi:MAG TPA: hypothetical protein VLN90_04525 [Thioalkalivibrio sp.]|nr:hypothetical protein [Thioalkalivibrio sp.]
MRFLFFLVVLVLLVFWAAFFSRPNNKRLSNILYIIGGVMTVLLVAGYLRLV